MVCLVPLGFGNYLARPLFRDQEDKLPSMDEASATKLLHDALKACGYGHVIAADSPSRIFCLRRLHQLVV